MSRLRRSSARCVLAEVTFSTKSGPIGAVVGEIRLKIAGPHLLDSGRGYLRRLDAQAG